jgi:NTE family protein
VTGPRRRPEAPPRIGLALGSGGARGLAHLGVLEVFDELGFCPAWIAGTSMGAVIGAAYCAGHSAESIRRHVLAQAASPMTLAGHVVQSRAGPLGDLISKGIGAFLLDGDRLLRRVWPDPMPEDFSDLAIPFTAIAGSLRAARRVAMETGPLRSAVAASMAIPGLFQPVTRDGDVLIDGVTVDPVPVTALRQRADLVVAVEVNGAASEGTAAADAQSPAWTDPIMLSVAGMSVMEHTLTRELLRAAPPDLLLQPPLGRYKPLDFHHARAILACGDALKPAVRDWLRQHASGA